MWGQIKQAGLIIVHQDYHRVKVREGRIGEITEILAWYCIFPLELSFSISVIITSFDLIMIQVWVHKWCDLGPPGRRDQVNRSVWGLAISHFLQGSFFSFLFKKGKIFLILSPESPPSHREHWDCVCVWDPLPEYWHRHPAELYQVVIANE